MQDVGQASRDDRLLIGRLASVNSQVARFIVRELDVDAGVAESMTPDEELALAKLVEQAGRDLRSRATRRIEGRER